MTRIMAHSIVILALAATASRAQSVDFEGLSEGFYPADVEIDGVRFFDSFALPGDPGTSWAADIATGVWNVYFKVLDYVQDTQFNVNGYSGTPDIVAFTAIKSFKVSPPEPARYVGLSVLYRVMEDGRDYTLNRMWLEAYRDGEKVGQTEPIAPANVLFDTGRSTSGASRLVFSGVEFDTIQFLVSGPTNLGTILGGIDNVTFDPPAIVCEDVRKLTSRCRNGRIKARLKLRGGDYDGEPIVYRVDNALFDAAVSGKKAKIKHPAAPGARNIGIVSPTGCVEPQDVICQ